VDVADIVDIDLRLDDQRITLAGAIRCGCIWDVTESSGMTKILSVLRPHGRRRGSSPPKHRRGLPALGATDASTGPTSTVSFRGIVVGNRDGKLP
jgi:hypothetical protein